MCNYNNDEFKEAVLYITDTKYWNIEGRKNSTKFKQIYEHNTENKLNF